jgi:hypothetical protein
MAKKWFSLMIAALLICAGTALAQESSVKGNLGGTVYDATGAVVPGAKVTMTGSTGSKTMESEEDGTFLFSLLSPGTYSLKVEKQGFKTAEVKTVEVLTNRTSSIRISLEPGNVTTVVEVSEAALTVDVSSTGIGANLSDSFYQTIPVTRGIAGLFYLSPGVASGGGTGSSNPSISGGSGLENLYIADGVNITDQAFGGLGVFSRTYRSLGTGINLSFVKEVQVKTGAYEPQYGRATGGIVQIVTKSGSKDYHGALTGFFGPQGLEATRLQRDDVRFNKVGKTLGVSNYDISGEMGGYVPGMRDHVFFFGSINPTYQRTTVIAPPALFLGSFGEMSLKTNTMNYAGKVTLRANDNHQFEVSVFGDPTHSGFEPLRSLAIQTTTGFSKLEYGTRNFVARWNGALSLTWLVNASFTWNKNRFSEGGFPDEYNIVDRTQAAGLPGQVGIFTAVGIGFFEPYDSHSYGFNIDTTKQFKWLGDHTFSLGYQAQRPSYDDIRERSGPRFAIPGVNAAGTAISAGVTSVAGQLSNAQFSLRLQPASCTLCPFMTIPGFATPQRVGLRQDRGEFGDPAVSTKGSFHSIYTQDSWSPNKYLTMNLGLRWEQQNMAGTSVDYTFTDNWSPRMGVIVDPWGDRKTKAFANYGRYNYAIPLDMAIRSLSTELDFTNAVWAPAFTGAVPNQTVTINSFGTVTPVLDSAHLLNLARTTAADIVAGACVNAAGCGIASAPSVSLQAAQGIASGTKMEFVDEFVFGIERELKNGFVVSARYIDRRMKRIVEDIAGISPEGLNAGLNQNYLITNVNALTDLYANERQISYTPGTAPPAACGATPVFLDPVQDTFGNTLGAVCFQPFTIGTTTGLLGGELISDGQPDGFPDPVRNYKAVEIEVNKAFSHNWQMRANWRIASLFGNFEGAFRNDNGQTDPSISSLFDFVGGQFGLLGDQFRPGPLNTDKRNIVNVYTSYLFDKTALKNMTFGIGVRWETGQPINDLKAHPAYLNSGEIPVNGRGSLGRHLAIGTVDLHVDYPWKITERWKLRLGMDIFNLANSKRVTNIDQNEDVSFGTANVDFTKPLTYQRPFYMRYMVKLEF